MLEVVTAGVIRSDWVDLNNHFPTSRQFKQLYIPECAHMFFLLVLDC
jgi:hypothetical protein